MIGSEKNKSKWVAIFTDGYGCEMDVKRFRLSHENEFFAKTLNRIILHIEVETTTGEHFQIKDEWFSEFYGESVLQHKIKSFEIVKYSNGEKLHYFINLQDGGLIQFNLKLNRKGEDQCEKHQRKRSRGLLKTIFKALKTSSSLRK